jgi:hypothetical protein
VAPRAERTRGERTSAGAGILYLSVQRNPCEERELKPDEPKPCGILSRESAFDPNNSVDQLQEVSNRVCWLT